MTIKSSRAIKTLKFKIVNGILKSRDGIHLIWAETQANKLLTSSLEVRWQREYQHTVSGRESSPNKGKQNSHLRNKVLHFKHYRQLFPEHLLFRTYRGTEKCLQSLTVLVCLLHREYSNPGHTALTPPLFFFIALYLTRLQFLRFQCSEQWWAGAVSCEWMCGAWNWAWDSEGTLAYGEIVPKHMLVLGQEPGRWDCLSFCPIGIETEMYDKERPLS